MMAKKYTQEKVAQLLAEYEKKMEELRPILQPQGNMTFKQFGVLNAARVKEKRFRNNIIVLKMASRKEYPDHILEELLQ